MLHLKLNDLISDQCRVIPFRSFKFNGGEISIRIAYEDLPEQVLIETSLTNSEKVMELIMATDALRRMGFKNLNLFCPYVPYSRQDRVCNPGEALSIKAFCTLINSQRYQKVYTLDNHSDVCSALLSNQVDIDVPSIIAGHIDIDFKGKIALVSPDAGALKRTHNIAKRFSNLAVIECSKTREVSTGEITGVKVHNDSYSSLDYFDKLLIIDDICDGGRTFVELAKVLRENGAKRIELFVSHGIFSKGLGVFDGIIDDVFTTKSFKNEATDLIGVSFKTPER